MRLPTLAGTGQAQAERGALRFVVLIGVVSLFADMTYEGARAITGPFLATLGASGTVVGVVAGLGELLGYALRLVSGYLSDRTRRYWTLTIVGYTVNMLAVPLLALAGRWEIAAGLIIAERVGKAIRTPPRDVMLSHASSRLGRGWAFGLHEALDQAGAVVGPLLMAGILLRSGRYDVSFAVLVVPALLALGVLTVGRVVYPQPEIFEKTAAVPRPQRGLPRSLWIYLAAVACLAAGYADFPLIAFHLKKLSVVGDSSIPLLYALAMAVDGLAALLLGRIFDKWGFAVLIPAALLSALTAPLAFSVSAGLALTGVVLWGVGMGAQESIVRAAVAGMIPAERRGAAYGMFNAVYGVCWFAGSALMGGLYDLSIGWLVGFSVIVQLLAVPLLLAVRRTGTVR